MPIAVCSPMNSRPLPQYASSPTTHHQQPSGKQISLSALMGNRADADGLDLYGVAPLDEVDDTTFSELVPSITEPNTSSPVSSPFGSKRPVHDLSNPYRNELASAATEIPDDVENILQNCHDGPSELCACSFRSHAPQSLDAINDGLEWDDSGDLRGLRPKSGSLSSGFGRYSLPLVSGGGSYRGAGTGIRNCSETTSLSGMEPIPPDKPRRSSFTLAAAAAEALVSARGRYGARRLSSSSVGNKLTSSRVTDKAPLGSSPTQRESPSNTLASKKTRRPPVCSSTPAQRSTNGHINHERHVDSETRLPTSSESPTIPAQRIRITPAPTIVTDTITAFNKTSFDRPSRLVTSGSTETMHSLFLNAPVNGVTSQTGTSRSFGDLTGPITESAYLSALLANQKWEECLENPLVQLGLIRSRDAAPLLGLLDRLEQGFPQCINQSELTNTARATRDTSVQELEEERIQLDIDRSFLQFYKKELNSWKELAHEYRQAVAGSPCGPQASTVSHMDQTQLAIDAFVDWLSVLQNRITVCLNHLNRRALWIDQLNGFTHELKSSFVVLEERVRNSLQRTRDMLIAWRERQNQISSPGRQVLPSSRNRPMDEPDIPRDRTQLIEALDDLQNFSDGVLTFQVRLGSCHLVNDCWSSKDLLRPVPCMLRERERPEASVPHVEDYRPTPGNTSFSSSFSSFLDPGVDTESSCTESTHLHAVTERAERLQRRLRVAIRRLERAIIAPTNSSLPVVKELTSKGDQPATLSVSSTPIPSDATLSTEPTYPLTPSLPHSDPNCWFISRRFSFQILSLMFLCFVFVCTHHFANTTSFFADWLARFRYPFCPHRPGSVVVDFSPNWWVRQLACLQLPSSKDITL